MHGLARACGVLAAVAVLAGGTRADDPGCGTIDTTGAVLETGAAPAAGAVVLDGCAREEERPVIPALPELGSVGTFTADPGAYEAPPDISPEVPQDFHPASSTTLVAGDHVFASITIDPGIAVAVAPGAEVWTTGDVLVQGEMRFSGAGLLHCGGDLTLDGGDGSARITTLGTNGPVELQIGGSFHAGTRDEVISSRQGLRIETFGTPPGSGDVWIEGPFFAVQEDIVIHASGSIRISGDDAHVEADYGTIAMRAFGGDIQLDDYASVLPADTDDAAPAVFEAAGGVRLLGGSEIEGGRDCAVRVSAFGGDMLVQESTIWGVSEFDDGWLRAAGSIVVEGEGSYVDLEAEAHSVDVRAFGGAVEFRELEDEMNWSYLGGRSLRVAAATGVRLERVVLDAYCDPLEEQSLAVTAHDGSIVADGRCRLRTLSGRAGAAMLQASDGILLAGWSESWIRADGFDGLTMLAGTGGIDLDMPYVDALGGGVSLLCEGPVGLDTQVTALGDVDIVSTRSWVAVPGSSVTTQNASEGAWSGAVTIESWAGAAGRVDASGSTLRTGTSNQRSGDVTLRVVQAGGTTAIDSYLLPSRVKTKVNRKDVSASRITIQGDLDLGTSGPDLTSPTTLRIGDRTFDIPGLTANKKGNKLTYADEALDVKVTTDRNGSSHGGFTVKLRGDPAEVGDPDGMLTLGLACGEMDARCAVTLDGGDFRLGRVRGSVVEPAARLHAANVVVKGAGKDRLSLRLGLTSGGGLPAEAPDVTIGIGDAWEAEVPGTSFASKKGAFRFRGDASGIRKVTLDPAHETLSVSGKGLDLGPHVDADGLLTLRVAVGTDAYEIRVRLRQKGASFSY